MLDLRVATPDVADSRFHVFRDETFRPGCPAEMDLRTLSAHSSPYLSYQRRYGDDLVQVPVRNAAYDKYDRSAYRIFDPSRGEKHRKQRSGDQSAVQADQPEIAPGPAEPELRPDKDIDQHELGKAAANGRDAENFEPEPVPSGKNDAEVCRAPSSVGKDTVVSLPFCQKNYAERPCKESLCIIWI